MSPSCPISTRRVDANMARMISLQVLLFTLLFLVTQYALFLYIILFDFTVRAFRRSELSFFSLLGKAVLSACGASPRPSDEAPKRFALYLGLGTVLFALILHSFGYAGASVFVMAILFFCASLEALFDFCIGCRIYYAIQLLKAVKNDRNIN